MVKTHLKHILVQHRHEAEDLQKKLLAGGVFEDLARKFSTCPSSEDGGDLGFIEHSRLDDDFAEAAAALKPGEVSGIVRSRFGYHLILRHA